MMTRYINADLVLEETQTEADALMGIYYRHIGTLSDKMLARLDGVIHGLESVRYRIKNVPTADVREVMASAWIPVSERLPEKYGWYLCTLKDNRVNELYYSNGIWLDNAKKHLFDLYDIRSRFTGEIVEPEQESVYWTDWVIAWMPKPEPYRGNE